MNDLREQNWPRTPLEKANLDLRLERREHRNTRRWCDTYRRLALLGWLAAVGALWLPNAKADVLPQGSIACVDKAAWSEQMSVLPMLAQGCVYTYRDYQVRVEHRTVFSGTTVWVEGKDMLVWVDGGVLRP